MKSSGLMTVVVPLLLSFAWQTASARHQDEKISSDSLYVESDDDFANPLDSVNQEVFGDVVDRESGSGDDDDNGDFDDDDDDDDDIDGNGLDDPVDRSDHGIEKEDPTVTDGYGKGPDDSDDAAPDEARNSLNTGADHESGNGDDDNNGDFDDDDDDNDDDFDDDDGDDGNELDDPVDRSDHGIEKEGPTVTDGYGKGPDDSDDVTPDETRNSLDNGADHESGNGDDDEDRNGGSGIPIDGSGNEPRTENPTVTAGNVKGPDDVKGTKDFGFPPKGTGTESEIESPVHIQDSPDEAVASLREEVRTIEVVVFVLMAVMVAILVACSACLIRYCRKKCRTQLPTPVSRPPIYKSGNNYNRLLDDSTQQTLSCVVDLVGDCRQTTTRALRQPLIQKEVC